jgi:hypothetical protein
MKFHGGCSDRMGRFFDGDSKITVPAPSTDLGKPWLWDFLAKEASALRRIGFTALQLPPASRFKEEPGVVATGTVFSTCGTLAVSHNREARPLAMAVWILCGE